MALVFTLCVICVICGLQRPMTSAARPQVRLNRTAAHGLPGRWGPQISQIIQIIGGGGDAGGSCAPPLRYPSNLWFTTSDDIGGPPSGQVEPNRSPRFVRTVGPTDFTDYADYWGCGDAAGGSCAHPLPHLCNLWVTTTDDIGGRPSGQVEPNRSPRFARTVGPTDFTD